MKLPYGLANFEKLITEDYYYVDRTSFIEKLENIHSEFLIFLRPRRFGKSLFVSMLHYYYDVKHAEQFQNLFGRTQIGKSPTAKAGQYQILHFDFSAINTSTEEKTISGFLNSVRYSVKRFMNRYLNLSESKMQEVLSNDEPADLMKAFFYQADQQKIYLTIDEYDHFANEILAFDFERFKKHIGENGFVRKFYETLKQATGAGIIDRIFITGVTPITMDGLTSGFNIGSDISTQPNLNNMMGFSEVETLELMEDLLKRRGDDLKELPRIGEDLQKYYNGYRFSPKAEQKIYNPDMVLYFAKEYDVIGEYPSQMIDNNIASDYGKIRRLFKIQNERKNYETLERLIEDGEVHSKITTQYSFEKEFNQRDFVSLLFYLGFLSITGEDLRKLIFKVPNHVIKELYWDYFIFLMKENNTLSFEIEAVEDLLYDMAQENRVEPFIQLIENSLKALSNRDFRNFDEKYVQALFVGFANLSNLYFIQSEREVEKKYPDIMLLFRNPYRPNFQFIFELKYLKKGDAEKLQAVTDKAKDQIRTYLESDELKSLEDLKAWVVVFVGDQAKVVEEIDLT